MNDDSTRAPRFTESMPKPLLAAFVALAVAAVGLTVVGLAKTSTPELPVAERRPAPVSTFTHDAGVVQPVTDLRVDITAPCAELEGVEIVGGGHAATRLYHALSPLCPLARGGVPASVRASVRALSGATVRFGRFELTGVESTLDRATRTVWVNARFALRSQEVLEISPIILHEAFHLARGTDDPSAEEELHARAAELHGCRHLIRIAEWPRWCEDARALTEMPRTEALAALRGAGYR